VCVIVVATEIQHRSSHLAIFPNNSEYTMLQHLAQNFSFLFSTLTINNSLLNAG
jgi:hypothetical protein